MTQNGSNARGALPFAAPAASVPGDVQATGTAASVPHSDHVHGREAFGAPSTQAFGDSAVMGTAATVPHSDHKHAMPANPVSYGTPGSSAVGDAAAAGSATTLPRSDHVHGREAFATPTIGLGSSASAGTVNQPIRADANIAAFDTFTASTQAFGDGATTGAVNKAARRDHVHGMPANPVTAHNAAAAQHLLPANVNVLGNRNTSGEFVQYGIASNTYSAGTPTSITNYHDSPVITYPIAFTVVRSILIAGGDMSQAFLGVAFANNGTSTFKVRTYDNISASYNGAVHWMAVGF